ncbi:MAG: hypothetical protein VKJ64_03585, partial [Leptolyngbyaceae bacterium]|nr:hypothetical protein [Leptolyngbyaceae bacterium]
MALNGHSLPDPNSSSPPSVTTEAVSPNSLELEMVERVAADDLDQLLAVLPPAIAGAIAHHPTKDQLIEIIMDLGRQPEVRFPDRAEYLSDELVTAADLRLCVEQIGQFSGDNRAGIE